jgi:hypothetical protein
MRRRRSRLNLRTEAQQIDLFAPTTRAAAPGMPAWSSLPAEARRALTDLMTRLILDHANGEHVQPSGEMRHDV